MNILLAIVTAFVFTIWGVMLIGLSFMFGVYMLGCYVKDVCARNVGVLVIIFAALAFNGVVLLLRSGAGSLLALR